MLILYAVGLQIRQNGEREGNCFFICDLRRVSLLR